MVTEHPDSVILLKGKYEEIVESFYHHDGTNDYTNSGKRIVEIRDREGRKVDLAEGDEWREVAPGIESCGEWRRRRLRIHRTACPVRVRWSDFYEYVSWTDSEHDSSGSAQQWVQYEAG